MRLRGRDESGLCSFLGNKKINTLLEANGVGGLGAKGGAGKLMTG